VKISCIIPSTGRQTLEKISLPSVKRQTRKFDQTIIVFDLVENSHDLAEDGMLILFTGGGAGGPAARKLAYEKSIGDFVVLLDDDDELDSHFVENLEIFLDKTLQKPCLVLPRVKKIWPEGRIPSLWVRPYSNSTELTDLSHEKWMPATSSGLVLAKAAFESFPINEKIQGFNDVQICEAARKSEAPAYYCSQCVVHFYQYFSIPRLTSNLNSRVKLLQIARENGINLSEAECKIILVAALFSQARSIAFKHGLIAAFKDIRQSSDLLPYLRRRDLYNKFKLNLIVIVWLSVVRLLAR
jgi:glycosyltransferase involved in cell wall biosynthesis